MELSIWDGISDMNEKTPPADMANGVLHNKKSTCFYLLVLYPRRHMPSIQNGKNISIHFTEDEISLQPYIWSMLKYLLLVEWKLMFSDDWQSLI